MSDTLSFCEYPDCAMVRRAHTAETDAAEQRARAEKAERTVAWLRAEPRNLEGWFIEGEGEVIDFCAHPDPQSIGCAKRSAIAARDIIKLRRHLASNPPKDWKP